MPLTVIQAEGTLFFSTKAIPVAAIFCSRAKHVRASQTLPDRSEYPILMWSCRACRAGIRRQTEPDRFRSVPFNYLKIGSIHSTPWWHYSTGRRKFPAQAAAPTSRFQQELLAYDVYAGTRADLAA